MRNTSGTYVEAFKVSTLDRANTIRDRLNELFNKNPGADLDFITPSYENGSYVVAWSGVQWFEALNVSTVTAKGGTTYENLYASCYLTNKDYKYASRADNFKVLATVTDADVSLYGKPAWEVALTWANAIRNPINGWNCIKNSTDPEYYGNLPLTIAQLKTPTGSISGTRTVGCTIYGIGEMLPSFTTGNTDIFHTCDLTIAQAKDQSLGTNKWVKLTYNGLSVVARVTDTSDLTTNIDLSSGVAYALGIKGSVTSGITISPP